MVKNLPASSGDSSDASSISGLGSLLEKEMASHSSILAWEIPWTEEPGGLQSAAAAAAAKSLQSCLTLCEPIPGILQARTLEWLAISFSNAYKGKVKVKTLSHVRVFATPWTAAHQAPPSSEFYRQEYHSGVPLPSLGYSLGDLKELDMTEHTHTEKLKKAITKIIPTPSKGNYC